jgi:hypothetical protein
MDPMLGLASLSNHYSTAHTMRAMHIVYTTQTTTTANLYHMDQW